VFLIKRNVEMIYFKRISVWLCLLTILA